MRQLMLLNYKGFYNGFSFYKFQNPLIHGKSIYGKSVIFINNSDFNEVNYSLINNIFSSMSYTASEFMFETLMKNYKHYLNENNINVKMEEAFMVPYKNIDEMYLISNPITLDFENQTKIK